MLVIGDREAESRTVAVRHRTAGDLGSMELNDFTGRLVREIGTRAR